MTHRAMERTSYRYSVKDFPPASKTAPTYQLFKPERYKCQEVRTGMVSAVQYRIIRIGF